MSTRDRLEAYARTLGFTLFGVAPATDADGFDRYAAWLDAGYAGEMAYLHEHNFITGSVAKVTAKAPDGSLSLRVGRETVVVGGLLGSNLYVSHA